ncbi:MAG: hypothetical protein FWE82_00590 [Defluviitaleaceae bacterium]|nr:hypothetical protein [Defluviitaleaceae bacterium]
MKKFVQLDKLSKRARKERDARERRTWGGLNPATRVLQNKKTDRREKARWDAYDDSQPGFFAACKIILKPRAFL